MFRSKAVENLDLNKNGFSWHLKEKERKGGRKNEIARNERKKEKMALGDSIMGEMGKVREILLYILWEKEKEREGNTQKQGEWNTTKKKEERERHADT